MGPEIDAGADDKLGSSLYLPKSASFKMEIYCLVAHPVEYYTYSLEIILAHKNIRDDHILYCYNIFIRT